MSVERKRQTIEADLSRHRLEPPRVALFVLKRRGRVSPRHRWALWRIG